LPLILFSMLLGYDEIEKFEILRNAISISKNSMKSKINSDLIAINNHYESIEINSIYEINITRLLNNPYLFRPKGDRNRFFRSILLHGMVPEIEVWEGIGGEITLHMTGFAYQFVKGKAEMVKILKNHAIEIIKSEFGIEVILRNYRPSYHKKKIVIEYANIDEEYRLNTLETAETGS